MTEIAKKVKLVMIGPDKIIAEEGRVMSKALFLLRGTVIMSREKEKKRDIIGHLKEKEWLCQLSLHLSSPLHCSYYTDQFDEVVFLTFDKEGTTDIYDRMVGRHYAAKLRMSLKFLAKFPFTNDLEDHKLILLASSCDWYCIESNTMLCRQGDSSSHIFFLKSGQVMVTR